MIEGLNVVGKTQIKAEFGMKTVKKKVKISLLGDKGQLENNIFFSKVNQ